MIKGKANFPEMNKSAFEELLKEVVEFYLKQDDVIDVIDIKRTHRQKDFNAVKEGEITYPSYKKCGKVTYVLHWRRKMKKLLQEYLNLV